MDNIKNRIKELHSIQIQNNRLHKPSFYRIYNPDTLQDFKMLLNTPNICLSDNILGQLKELMKIQNPSKKLTENELKDLALQHIGGRNIEEYGIWVYYPWSNKLVHILDEKEFIEVRTSRNLYKITPEERDILSQKKIGVIGLSVGQSVSLTMAMERIGGELRLADFDTLELTNLNRIRTGIHNLGLPKVYAVAREIAEIDPFLKVTCYPEGLSEQNMDTFFLDGGKLDLLVEESDGFDIKILSRYKAKELQVPVIMEASDRCTVDVERFDLEPNRSILHGLVDHLDISTLKNLKTTEDKIPYLLDMVGIETASVRLKASMLEIDQTINTWPQLASAVTMGGGITADVARRMLLNTFTESGRYHVDIEELIGNKKKNNLLDEKLSIKQWDTPPPLSLTNKEMENIAMRFKPDQYPNEITLEKETLTLLLNAAIKAPTGGNSQPWKWLYRNKILFLFHDIEKSACLLDYNNLASYIGLGAACENLILTAHQNNLDVSLTPFPLEKENRLVATLRFSSKTSLSSNLQSELVDKFNLAANINTRVTNRNIAQRQIIDNTHLQTLQTIASEIEGASLTIIDNQDDLKEMADIIGKIERLRLMDPRGHHDFINEVRWNKQQVVDSKTGVDIETVDLTAAEKAGFIISKNWEVVNTLKKWKKGHAYEKLSHKTVLSSSALGFITMPQHNNTSYFNGGRSVQKVWLAANHMNIALQPQSPLTFFFSRLIQGKGVGLDDATIQELHTLRTRFKEIVPVNDNTGEIFLFRLCIAPDTIVKSLRRDISDVFLNNSIR